jgi:MFS superfamily sulfate permease-like transporter
LVVGPDTATGLLSALTIGAVAAHGTAEFNSLTSTLAVMIGVLFLFFGLARMGWVASFIPTPVMRAFIEGLVYVTIIGQVPHLLGLNGTSGNFFAKLWYVLQHIADIPVLPALTGITCLAVMLLLRHLAPSVPAALVVMSVATIVIGLLGGEASGLHVAGHVPSGLPGLTVPNLDIAILRELLPGALAIVLVGYAEALGAAKAAAIQDGSDIDANQELIAHGPANILTGLFGGFLVVGSLSKTSVAMAAGARSQVANLIAAAFCFLTLIWLTPLFRNMPQPALAAIVIAAMLHLTKPNYLRTVLARSHWSFAVALIVIAGELTLGVLHGIGLGVTLSIARLIYLASRPKGAALGQLPGTEAYRDVRMHPEAITFPGLLIWRIGGDLFFASVGHIGAALRSSASAPSVRRVLLDFGSVDFLDITGGDELLRLVRDLHTKGISTGFARVRDSIRDDMRRAEIEAFVGPDNFYERITDGVHAWQRQAGQSICNSDRKTGAGHEGR